MEEIRFKHCHIAKHPLRECYMVVNDTFPCIAPYIGSFNECKKAAEYAERSAEDLLGRMVREARREGHSEAEIEAAAGKMMKRRLDSI